MKESLILWLTSQPAGFAAPAISAGAGFCMSKPSFSNGPSKLSITRSNFTPICDARVQPVMS